MTGRFQGKVAGVSGANSPAGIGFAIARELLKEGACVFICGSNEAKVKNAESLLKEFGNVKGYAVDISDENQVHAMFEDAVNTFGRLDYFVSNAGMYPQKLLMDMSVEEWDRVMAVNLRSAFICAKECYKHMKDGGAIVQSESYAEVIPSAGSGAYAASKSAMMSLTRTLASELAPYNIRVNGIVPGVIETDLTAPVIATNHDRMIPRLRWDGLARRKTLPRLRCSCSVMMRLILLAHALRSAAASLPFRTAHIRTRLKPNAKAEQLSEQIHIPGKPGIFLL